MEGDILRLFDPQTGIISRPQQPLVVVAISLFMGIYLGDKAIEMVQDGELVIWGAFSIMVLSVSIYLWRRWLSMVILSILMLGSIVAGAERVSGSSLYDGSTVKYIKERGFTTNNNSQDWKTLRELEMESGSLAQRINSWAAKRIERLSLDESASGLLNGIVLGRKWAIDPELRSRYGYGGASHLLAVSGLHLGVVCLVFNLVLSLLSLIHHGHLVRSVIMILLIWGYAAVVGMPLSVIRASIMFTILQMTYLTGRSYESLNVLSMTALMMVIFRPAMIYDAGFLLSVIAVLGILIWGAPTVMMLRNIFRKYKKIYRARFLWYLVGAIFVSLSCVVATMPICSYLFGYITLWGVITSPIVIATTTTILAISMIWILIGLGFMAPLFSWLLNGIITLQNLTIESLAHSWVIEVQLDEAGVVISYLLLAIFTVLFQSALRSYSEQKRDIDLEWENILAEEEKRG